MENWQNSGLYFGDLSKCPIRSNQESSRNQLQKHFKAKKKTTTNKQKTKKPTHQQKNLIVFWYNCSIIGMKKQQPTTSLINCVCTWGTSSIAMWEIATPWTTSVNHICSQVFFISVIDAAEQFTIRNAASQVLKNQANTGSPSTFFYTSHLQCCNFTGIWSLHLFMSFMSSVYSTTCLYINTYVDDMIKIILAATTKAIFIYLLKNLIFASAGLLQVQP